MALLLLLTPGDFWDFKDLVEVMEAFLDLPPVAFDGDLDADLDFLLSAAFASFTFLSFAEAPPLAFLDGLFTLVDFAETLETLFDLVSFLDLMLFFLLSTFCFFSFTDFLLAFEPFSSAFFFFSFISFLRNYVLQCSITKSYFFIIIYYVIFNSE